MSIVFVLYHLFFIGGIYPLFGFYLTSTPFRAGSLGLLILATYLFYSAKTGHQQSRIPWYDWLLLVLGFVPCVYFFFAGNHLLELYGNGQWPVYGVIALVAVLISLFEAGRRSTGIAFPIIALTAILLLVFQKYLPGPLHGRGWNYVMLSGSLVMDAVGILGEIVGLAATLITVFIAFGTVLIASGAGDFLNNLAFGLVGNFRGGPAKVAVVASALMGTMSGSPVANVATIGSFTIPLMKRVGYSAEYAAGVEAVSSNGGQIMPPVMGLVAFVMAGVTGFSYASICVAAIIPAILYYLAIFVQVDLQAAKRGFLGQPRDKLPSVSRTIKEGWYYAIPVVLLFYLMVGARVSPEQSALYGLLCALAVGMINRKYRFNVKRLVDVMMQITKMMVMPGISCAIAATLDSSLGFSGIGLQFSGLLVEWSHGSLIFLIFLTAIACYFLGLGLTAIASYIIVAALVAPALMDFGVNKMAVHFFVFYYAISSFITPPVAVAAFVAAGIANANPMSTGWRAMHLGIIAYIIPVYFIYDQTLLGYGPLYKVVLGGLAAAIGTVGLGVALEGFLWSRLNWFKRGLVAAGALLLIKPGIITGLSGACIVFGMIVYEYSGKRLSRRETAGSAKPESGGL